MQNLKWGGYTNGQIDTSILVDVSGKGDYLEPTAAAQFLRMRADLFAATGVWINPAPGSSAYRPVSIQEAFYVAYLNGTGPTAAVPTTRGGQGSNHGWARAVDITGYEGSDSYTSPRTGRTYDVNLTVWTWLQEHAADYGYDWTTGDWAGEAWHWESDTPPGTAVASVSKVTPIIIPEEEIDIMWYIKCAERGDWLVGPNFKHHLGLEESQQVQPVYVKKNAVVDFGSGPAAQRAFDLFVSVHTVPTAK